MSAVSVSFDNTGVVHVMVDGEKVGLVQRLDLRCDVKDSLGMPHMRVNVYAFGESGKRAVELLRRSRFVEVIELQVTGEEKS